jgi:hypothetical protein
MGLQEEREKETAKPVIREKERTPAAEPSWITVAAIAASKSAAVKAHLIVHVTIRNEHVYAVFVHPVNNAFHHLAVLSLQLHHVVHVLLAELHHLLLVHVTVHAISIHAVAVHIVHVIIIVHHSQPPSLRYRMGAVSQVCRSHGEEKQMMVYWHLKRYRGDETMNTVKGVIKRRVLINYQLDAEAAADILPAPFRPKLVKGKAIIGICQIRMEEMRPKSLSKLPCGASSNNAAHRMAVVWEEDGTEREGVYIFRRDTDSRMNSLAGGRLFPGFTHYSQFDVTDEDGQVDFTMTAQDSVTMRFKGHDAENIPESSVFSSFQEISDFFKEGADGYSPAREEKCSQGICLVTDTWNMRPFHVESSATTFFADAFAIEESKMLFDSAVVMRDVEHEWQRIDSVG